MKLAVVFTEIDPFGGLQKHVLELLDFVHSHDDIELHIVCTELVQKSGAAEKLQERYKDADLSVIKVIGFKSVRLLSFLKFWRIVEELRGVDVIHLHDVRFGLFASYIAKKNQRIVLSSHGFIFHNGMTKLKRAAFALLSKLINATVTDIVCVSHSDYSIARNYKLKNPKLLENWTRISTHVCSPCTRKRQIVYFGRLEKSKGIEELLSDEFIGNLENLDVELAVVGSGSLESFVVSRANEYSQVSYKGRLSDAELLDTLCRSQWAIFPSYREGFGITVLEGLACGCECLLNDDSNYREIFPDAPVTFFSFSGIADFEGKLENTYSPNLRSSFLERYDYERSMQKLVQIYESEK